MNSIFRNIAVEVLSYFYKIAGLRLRGLSRNRVQFIYLHHLFPNEESGFRNLLHHLGQQHQFISYSEGIERILEGRTDGRFLTISFDDGEKNQLAASKILREFGISACFFVCPSRLDTQDENCLSWNDLELLLNDGHEIGSHTMTHARLSLSSNSQIEEEIAASVQSLQKRIGNIRHFAWPYGRWSDFSPQAAEIVWKTGLQSCASAIRGCHIANAPIDKHALCIRRDHVMARWPIGHVDYFLARNALKFSLQTNTWPTHD